MGISSQNNSAKILTPFFMLWALVLPWSLAAMQIALGLLFAAAVVVAVKFRRLNFLGHPFLIFPGIYLLSQFMAAFFSGKISHSLLAVVNTEWALFALPVLAAAGLSAEERQKIIKVLLISAALAGGYAVFQSFSGTDFFRETPLSPMGSFYRANGGYNFYLTLAGNELMAFSMAFAFLLYKGNGQKSDLLYLATGLLILAGILATFARSAWIALVFMAGLATLVVNRRLFLWGGLGMAIIVAGIAVAVPEIQERILSIFDVSQNETRLNLWKTSLAMVADNPFFGVGPGLFSEMFPLYKAPGFYDTSTHAHNDHINVAANSGLLGFLAWAALWIAWFYYAFQAFRRPGVNTGDRRILLGVILAVAGILVAGFFQCYYTDLENNILWWFLVILGAQIMVQAQRHPG